MAFTHPLATIEWMTKWELLSQLRQTLQQQIGEEAYKVAWEQGASRDLDSLIAEMQTYVGLDSSADKSPQPLIEPLTDRELDVLAVLGGGRSNREIAKQLTIAIGTVKAHVHNICQKLNVTNRTQAVLQAKKLGLL